MKLRNGFVSNSSSSSFIVDLSNKGKLYAEGLGCVDARIGLGFMADMIRPTCEADVCEYDLAAGSFWLCPDYERSKVAFIRSLTDMLPEQTLADFSNETVRLFGVIVDKFKVNNIKGPVFLAAGEIGNGG